MWGRKERRKEIWEKEKESQIERGRKKEEKAMVRKGKSYRKKDSYCKIEKKNRARIRMREERKK